MSELVPCVIFAFNRPQHLQRVLDALKGQTPDKLLIFVDAPRNDQEAHLVDACREIAANIQWVDKELVFHENNRGLNGISDDLDQVFRVYQAAAIIEDDCLPMPHFYRFIKDALAHYQERDQVFAIGGYQHLPKSVLRKERHSVIATWRFTCWGWATWRNRWRDLEPDRKNYLHLFNNLTNVPEKAGKDLVAMAALKREGKLKSWAVDVSLAMLWQEKVMILPTHGLIKNIGVDSGEHGNSSGNWLHNKNIIEDRQNSRISWLDDLDPQPGYGKAFNRIYFERSSLFARISRKLFSR